MNSMLIVLAVFSLAVAARPPFTEERLPAQPRRLHTAVPARQTGEAYVATSIEPSEADSFPIEQRQTNVQIPFMFCPEEFNSPPKLCT